MGIEKTLPNEDISSQVIEEIENVYANAYGRLVMLDGARYDNPPERKNFKKYLKSK
jgi:hypothetical protein